MVLTAASLPADASAPQRLRPSNGTTFRAERSTPSRQRTLRSLPNAALARQLHASAER